MKPFINTEDVNSIKIWLPLKYVFFMKSTGVLCHIDVALVCLGGVKVRADPGKGTELERHMGLLSGVFLIMGTMIGKEAAKEDRYLSSNSFFSVF